MSIQSGPIAVDAMPHRWLRPSLHAGGYINEARVSTVLGLGRTSVNQAIDRLMLDGMLNVIPRKGVADHGEVQNEDRNIFEAVKARNAEEAEAAMRRHIVSFQKNVVRYLDPPNSPAFEYKFSQFQKLSSID